MEIEALLGAVVEMASWVGVDTPILRGDARPRAAKGGDARLRHFVGYSMSLNIRPLTPVLGAEVTGIDLSKTVSEAVFQVGIETAFETYSVLVFRSSIWTRQRQIAFSERFGPLESTIGANPGGAGTAFAVFSNVAEDGSIIPPQDRRMLFDRRPRGTRTARTNRFRRRHRCCTGRHHGFRRRDGRETEFASLRRGCLRRAYCR